MEEDGGKKGLGQGQGGSSLLYEARGVKGAHTRRRGPKRWGKEDNAKSGSKEAGNSRGRGRGNRNRT
jgi:hypothetical protein